MSSSRKMSFTASEPREITSRRPVGLEPGERRFKPERTVWITGLEPNR